jgi:hypothetical protein
MADGMTAGAPRHPGFDTDGCQFDGDLSSVDLAVGVTLRPSPPLAAVGVEVRRAVVSSAVALVVLALLACRPLRTAARLAGGPDEGRR